MRLRFDPATDESAFTEAREALLATFEKWLAGRADAESTDACETAHDAAVALDWKFSYADGDLGWWRLEHVQEFLLEWCPRKFTAPVEGVRSLPLSLGTFVCFLDAEGLLTPGSTAPEGVMDAVRDMAPRFASAMSDPSRYGMAKSLLMGAEAEGIDVTAPEELERWVADFNRRPEQERRRLLPDSSLPGPSRPALPPVALPTEESVASSKSEAPILDMFAKLADFVGSGRRLTQKGNFNLADARELVSLLGTGDTVDFQSGTRLFRLRSAEELPVLRYVFSWARKAGILRVQHGKVMATKKSQSLLSDRVRLFDHAVDSLLALGPLSVQRHPERWGSWPDVDALLDQSCLALLCVPYSAQRPLSIDVITEEAAASVLETFAFPHLDDGHVARRIGWDVTDMMDILALAGVVQRHDVEPTTDPWVRQASGGTVELTPAGTATVRRLLVEAGYDAPEAGRFAEATAAELLLGTDGSDFATVWGELQVWGAGRSPDQAVAELADAAIEIEDPGLSNLAMAMMGQFGEALAVPHVRRLSENPHTRGLALCWLVDHGA